MIPKEILKKIRRIEIRTRHVVKDLFGGEYHSAFKGRGMDFAEVREYTPGDEVRTIDWNVSARMRKPYIKVFQEERELTVILAVDVSASCAFGSTESTKRELMAELGAVLAFSAIRNRDKVGLLLFSDHVENYVPPAKGSTHALRLIRDLLYYTSQSKGSDMAAALSHLSRVQKKKAIVFLISDFLSPLAERELRALRRRHDLIAVSVCDPMEEQLPDLGLLQMEDLESGVRRWVDTGESAFREKHANWFKQRRDNVIRFLRASRIDQIILRTGEDYILPIDRFFRNRSRRR
jgi:uncharacterized protein (DUF58 family)